MNIEDFYHKKILIFCPHEDDEINLVGGLLLALKKVKCEIKIVYSTNGDYYIDAKYRVNEAIKSLKKLGVSKDKIVFLGYPDCFSNYKTHLYMTNEAWVSPNGIQETYLPKAEEYHYKKHKEHAILNKTNFIADIFEIIEEEMADILICVDYDEHADHRALHLGFEKAMGRILNRHKEYQPIVLKAFAYPTEFFGVEDFKNHYLLKTKFNQNQVSLYECYNPYYHWEDRISIDIASCVKNKFLLLNPLFRAMTKHVSQSIYSRVYQIINSDQIFFQRRTDNLLYQSDVTSSSGDSSVLKDFMTFDSSNILNGETIPEIIDLGYMKFDKDDKEKTIQIIFDNQVDIEEMNIYQHVNCKTNMTQIKLIVDQKEMICQTERKNHCYRVKNLKLEKVKQLELVFQEYEELEISEIEFFSESLKIMDKTEEEPFYTTIWDKIIFKIDDFIIFMYKGLFKILRTFFIK